MPGTGLDSEPADATRPPVAPDGDAQLIFVGGTGRSGTHVVAKLLDQHPDLRKVPNEVRFHVDDDGYPGLLAGTTTPERFVRKLRGRWYRQFEPARMQFRGMRGNVPKDRVKAASERFLDTYEDDPVAACRALFYELLLPLAAERQKSGLVEQSCDTVAHAPELHRIFPQALFVHVVRDGRDAAHSRVSQAGRLIAPRTMREGLEWWEQRLRRIDEGIREVPDEQMLVVNLDELVDHKKAFSLRKLREFTYKGEGGRGGRRMRDFLSDKMSIDDANRGRWRKRLSQRKRDEIERLYAEALDRIEADEIHGWRSLRRVWEAEHGG